ncbi:MAG: competence protein ComEC, partial [Rubrivivax sp.]|nr:competence protein ComEC [Rubrivivax sp.]
MRAQVAPATLGLLMALAWLGGTAWQLQQAALWAGVSLAALVAAAFVVAGLAWRRRRRWAGALGLVLAVAALAFAATSGRAAWRLADALPPALEGQDLVVTGVVSA